jgi:hypothetical protein
MKGYPVRWLVLLLLLTGAGKASAQERYYMLIFGSQRTPPEPRYSHSFAYFVRVTADGPTCIQEVHHISWLPRTLDIRLLAHPECGVNLPIHDTLKLVLSEQQRVSLWGPYEINCELYRKAIRQVALLESGKVLYKAVDTGYRSDHASNCIHAISSIVEGPKLRVGSPGWGEMASWFITREMKPWIINPERTHDWLIPALGLDPYPILFRDLESPRSGGGFSAVRHVLHHEEQIRQRMPACCCSPEKLTR